MARKKGRIAPEQFEPLALREELEALVRYYHHLQNEHQRAPLESSVRRRIEDRLLDVRERIDRRLEEWIEDEELRTAWREHLHNRAPEPDGPEAIRPLVFRGVTEAGSDVEVREKSGVELEVRIDGALIERIAAEEDFASTVTPLRVRLDGFAQRRRSARLPKRSTRSPAFSRATILRPGTSPPNCSRTA